MYVLSVFLDYCRCVCAPMGALCNFMYEMIACTFLYVGMYLCVSSSRTVATVCLVELGMLPLGFRMKILV